MAGYIGSKASVVSNGAERKKVFDITTTTTSLTGCSYTPNQVHVFHNGVRLVDGTDYTATDGSTVTLTTAAQSGDEVVVVSYATFQPADAYTKTESDDRFVNVTGDTMTGALGIGVAPSYGLHVKNAVDAQAAGQFERTGGAIMRIQPEGFDAKFGTYSNTPLTFMTNSTARMAIDASGRVTMPYQPSFAASRHNAGSTTVSTHNIPALVDTYHNNGNHYNTSTFRFTAPVTGYYLFTAHVIPTSLPQNQAFEGWFSVNGSGSGRRFFDRKKKIEAETNNFSISGSAILLLNANDYVNMYTTTASYADETNCLFCGELLS